MSGLALAAALLLVLPRVAAAHADLVSSTPADGAAIALTAAPTTLTLTFNEEVAKDVTTVQVTGPDGASAASGPATISFDDPKVVTVGLNTLTSGKYSVKWHAVTSDDNGQTDGSFSFTIVNNTGGTTSGGTTSGGTTSGEGVTSSTLPTSGAPWTLPAALLAGGLALVVLSAGLVLRRGLGRRA